MKTKDFIKKVEELGFEVRNEYGRKGELVELRIGEGEEDYVVIWPKFTFAISTIEDGFTDFKYYLSFKELYELCFEYAKTPVEDRDEEKKFYLEHKYFKCVSGDSRYFQIYESDGDPWLNAMDSITGYKKQFTLKEIEEIKEKFDTDLADFELVEVKKETKSDYEAGRQENL